MGGPGSGPVQIAGTRYPNSFSVSACTVFSKQPTYGFDLAGRYGRLTGVVGQDDDSASRGAVLQLTVRGDGRTLASRTVRYGQSAGVSVDVGGVKRLTLSFTEVSCGSDGAGLAFGNGRVQ
jgi:NPCBM/NEW2 domain